MLRDNAHVNKADASSSDFKSEQNWNYRTLFEVKTYMLWFFFIGFCYLGWLVVLMINVDLAIFQPYLDLEAGDNQSLKIQVARPGIEPRSSCSASQELNHSATTILLSRKHRTDVASIVAMSSKKLFDSVIWYL